MTCTVTVDRLHLTARHGLAAQEQRVGNEFEVSVALTYTLASLSYDDALSVGSRHVATATDAPGALAIDYGEIVDIARAVMDRPRSLLEQVAAALAAALRARWPFASAGSVTIVKLTPPCGALMAGAGVTLTW